MGDKNIEERKDYSWLVIFIIPSLIVGWWLFKAIFYQGGEFSINPGQSIVRDEYLTENIIPGNEGELYRGFSPIEIESPEYITVEVFDTYSGGYYLNYMWTQRSSFNYQ